MAKSGEATAIFMMQITQIMKIATLELQKLSGDGLLSSAETSIIMCLATTEADMASQIARYTGVSRSLMSKAVDNLVGNGWIETKRDEGDRRVVHLCLLPKAEPAAAHCCDLCERFFAAMTSDLCPEDVDVFMRVVEQCANNIKQFISDETERAKTK